MTLARIKAHFERNKKRYAIASYFGVVIITFVVTKRVSTRYMHINGTSTFINKAVVKEGPLYNVFNIYSLGFKNQGPSWIVKCKETGETFRSQEHAAKMMKISKSLLSTHLNEKAENVAGYHFERLGVAA